jgi:hypothetical protein
MGRQRAVRVGPVISVASGTIAATIGGGPGTATLDAAPLGMSFVALPS